MKHRVRRVALCFLGTFLVLPAPFLIGAESRYMMVPIALARTVSAASNDAADCSEDLSEHCDRDAAVHMLKRHLGHL